MWGVARLKLRMEDLFLRTFEARALKVTDPIPYTLDNIPYTLDTRFYTIACARFEARAHQARNYTRHTECIQALPPET
jgi:hypothetical protein